MFVTIAALILNGNNRIAMAYPVPFPSGPPYHLVVIGDSITGGSDMGGVGPHGWPVLAVNTLQSQGIALEPLISGDGGSGYVEVGLNGTTFEGQGVGLIEPDDRVIVFFGSRNDMTHPIDVVADAMYRTFRDARNVAPYAVLVVIGPVWPEPHPPHEVLVVRDTLAREAAEADAVWVDPIAERWLTTPGMMGVDGIHPNNDGHKELASRIGPIIKASLGF